MNNIKILCLIFFYIILFIQGCQTFPDITKIKNEKKYCITKNSFKNKWWQFYERGQSCADGEFWIEAEKDFRNAIKRFRFDKRDARTYGMRYVARGYFPHRELGIALIKQNRYKEAIKELEESIKYESTSRAKDYLNLARKKLLSTINIDKSKPKIQIFQPTIKNIWTNKSKITLHAYSTDDTYIKYVKIYKRKFDLDSLQMNTPNQLLKTITAEKTDDTYIKNYKKNNKNNDFNIIKNKIQIWEKIPVESGNNSITILASDFLDNTSTHILNVKVDRIGPIISINDDYYNKSDTQFYAFDNIGIDEIIFNNKAFKYNGEKEISAKFNEIAFSIIVKDIAGNKTSYSKPLKENSYVLLASNNSYWCLNQFRATNINITKPEYMNNDKLVHNVYINDITLEGNIKGTNVKKILCNNISIPINGGSNNLFSFSHKLIPGQNGIIIRAFDNSGQLLAHKQILINKNELDVKKIDHRLKISLKFDKKDIEIKKLINQLTKIIINKNRFNLTNNYEDADCFLNIFLMNSTQSYYEISASLIDKETNISIANVDNSLKNPLYPISVQQKDLLLNTIHTKLENEVPLYEGNIIELLDSTKEIKTNMGKICGIFKNMKIIIFNEQHNLILAKSRISSVDEFFSYAKINKKFNNIKNGDYVITQ